MDSHFAEDIDFIEADGEVVVDNQMGALEFGLAYAFAGHLFDRQTDQILQGQRREPQDVVVEVEREEEPTPKLVNAAEGKSPPQLETFYGQEPLKREILVSIKSAQARNTALEHVLLASGMPGVGKTTMARIIAELMGSEIIMLVPPFHEATLHEAATRLPDKGVLFIDEIHKLADYSKRGAELLLHPMEERRIYTRNGDVIKLNDITIVGATTEADKLPQTIIDRFMIKPYFQPYSPGELELITNHFAGWFHLMDLPDDLVMVITDACRGTPRVIRELVLAARDLRLAYGHWPSDWELLNFKGVTPDGLTRNHVAYLTNLLRHFRRDYNDGRVEYVAGEFAMMTMLRETKQGINLIERYLMECGLIDRSPQGRRLTEHGLYRAQRLLKQGATWQ